MQMQEDIPLILFIHSLASYLKNVQTSNAESFDLGPERMRTPER